MSADRDAVLLALAEIALERVQRDGAPRPGGYYRRVITGAVWDAPQVAVNCPRVLQFTGVTKEQLRAISAGVWRIRQPRWITVEQAGELLGLKPNSVRWLLRHGKLTGRRDGATWLVDSRSVARYSTRRQAA